MFTGMLVMALAFWMYSIAAGACCACAGIIRRARMSEFLAMGGYAWYVWGSYGVTFLCLADRRSWSC